MKEDVYLSTDTVIVNLSAQSCRSVDELVGCLGFSAFLQLYFKQLAVRDIRVYRWLTNGRTLEETVPSLIELAGQLLVSGPQVDLTEEMNELDRLKALYIVEDCYRCWRSKKRFTVLNGNRSDAMAGSFAEYDEKYNALVWQLYRTCRQKLTGQDELVCRKSDAGSNASCLLAKYRIKLPAGYGLLRNVPFINRLLLRTPILMDFEAASEDNRPQWLDGNPLASLPLDSRDYLCLPLKVGEFLCLTYFHRDYLAQAVCLVNLFELASESECLSRKPELICLFGLPGDHGSTGYYWDSNNDVHLAAVSGNYNAEHFTNFRNVILTLHSLTLMDRGMLPVRGAMMEIFFRDDSRKRLLLIGEMGAGKSETIEALRTLSNEVRTDKSIRRIEMVFDEIGSLRISADGAVARGSAIGSLERINDLWPDIYRDIEKGIFINLQKDDPKVLLPITGYEMVNSDHPVDMVLYANNYQERIGLQRFTDYRDCRRCLLEGRHAVSSSEGQPQLVETSFANPYIPEEKKEQYLAIMDEVFGRMYEDGVFVGQLFTNLACGRKEDLAESARCLWDLLRQLDS